jgi:hypothetical protein
VTVTETEIAAAVSARDLDDARATYWAQSEFLFVPAFLSDPLVARLQADVEAVRPLVHRNYVPRHKQGGSVSAFALRRHAPAITMLYHSAALQGFIREIVKAPVVPCPVTDPHAYALYFYTRPGDHIGFHYDTSYYKGARYTVLVGLIERSSSRLLCRLHAADPGRPPEELRLATVPGSLVLFNGDKLYHAISPLGPGEERVSLTLEYVTNPEMGRAKRLFSDLKDAVAYFGFRELLRGRRVGSNRLDVPGRFPVA